VSLVLDPRPRDLEALEALNQDEATRRIILRMAGLARDGQLPGFVAAIDRDRELDEETKQEVRELADESFLLAAENYLLATRRFH
jgi:hypothetical protein